MWKNLLPGVLLVLFAVELPLFGSDLLRFLGRIGIRELTIIALVLGLVVIVRQLGPPARRR